MGAIPAILKSIKVFIILLLSIVLEFILPIVPAIVVVTYLVISDRNKALQYLRREGIKYSNSRARRRTLRKWLEYVGVIALTHYLGTYYFPSIQLAFIDELLKNYPFILYGLVTLEIIGTEIESNALHVAKLGQKNGYWIKMHEFITIPSTFINKIVEKLKSKKKDK